VRKPIKVSSVKIIRMIALHNSGNTLFITANFVGALNNVLIFLGWKGV